MPDIIKIHHQQNQSAPQNLPAVEEQTANAWWSDLCAKSLTVPKGPARDLSDITGLSHLFVVKDAPDNQFSLEAVRENPNPQQLYTLAQQGRLLLTPTGATGGTYQVQVQEENPQKSALLGVTEQAMAQRFTDPRQGVGYWLMRICNTLSGGYFFSERLAAMDQEAATADAMTQTVKQSFLSRKEADAEWRDPAHLRSLQKAGYITQPAAPQGSVQETLLASTQRNLRRNDAFLDFTDNLYELFGDGKFPDILEQTNVFSHPTNPVYEMTGNMDGFQAEDMALLAFLALSDPTLEYYQSPQVADFKTLDGTLSGADLIEDRVNQFFAGMLGDKSGAANAVYIPCCQAAQKIDEICNDPSAANPRAFAPTIIHGLQRLQNTLATANEPNDRFMQSAALAGHVVKLLRSNPALHNELKHMGFQFNTKLFDQADNFYQMQVKAMKAKASLHSHALGFPHKAVPEEILEESLPIIAESRFQTMNIQKNGLQSVLPLYGNSNVSGNVHNKIIESSNFQALNGKTYQQIDDLVHNNARMFKLYNQGIQDAEQSILEAPKQKDLSVNNPEQVNAHVNEPVNDQAMLPKILF